MLGKAGLRLTRRRERSNGSGAPADRTSAAPGGGGAHRREPRPGQRCHSGRRGYPLQRVSIGVVCKRVAALSKNSGVKASDGLARSGADMPRAPVYLHVCLCRKVTARGVRCRVAPSAAMGTTSSDLSGEPTEDDRKFLEEAIKEVRWGSGAAPGECAAVGWVLRLSVLCPTLFCASRLAAACSRAGCPSAACW